MAKKKATGGFDTLYQGLTSPKPKPKKPADPSLAPTTPTSVAPGIAGTYDPALDAQWRANQRGVQQLQADTALADTRGQEDLGTATGLATRNQQRNQADFQTQLDSLFHNFHVQRQQQVQAANQAGVIHGGTLDAAAQVRHGNLARAEQPIHTNQQRSAEDFASRMLDINRTAGRGSTDRQTKLQRAIAEGGFYGQDLRAEAAYQAQQNNPSLLAGLTGPSGPSGASGKTPKQGKTPKSPSTTPPKKKGKK